MVDNPKTKLDTNKELQIIENILQSEMSRRQEVPKTTFLGRNHPSSFRSKKGHFETQTADHPTLSSLAEEIDD